MSLLLRPAAMADAKRLLDWRNDPHTREASFQSDVIRFDDHCGWLERVLANDSYQLWIAELDGQPVGHVRACTSDVETTLSWMVAPSARGKGVGKQMVKMAVKLLSGKIRAEVKSGNAGSARIAEFAGLVLVNAERDVLVYEMTNE
ncbi:MAG: GNAT family N-acetyltransferase [Hahellaceae bacterium]|nr:GNAT family N-acetyltransferase [Hahellaceae bacterium]